MSNNIISSEDSFFSVVTRDYTNIFTKNAYIAPNIPEKKLNGSIKSLTKNIESPTHVLFVFDSTLFGSGTDGILISKDTFYYKEMFEEPHTVKFNELNDAIYTEDISKNKNGKETINKYIIIKSNSDSWNIQENEYINLKALASWLLKLHNLSINEKAVSSDKKIEIQSLENLPSDIQCEYIKVIINFLKEDNYLDNIGLSKLYSLWARLNISNNDRLNLLMYDESIENLNNIIDRLYSSLDDLAKQEIKFSLVKDLLDIYMQVNKNDNYTQSKFIKTFVTENSISENQIKLFIDAIHNDRKIYNDDVNDTHLEQGFRDIASGAATVGIPLAALYFSGSVIGLGATGITSGLAALGLGGIFGISSMVTGIGAVILIGIGAKKGIEHLTGQNEIDQKKRKEALLLGVVKNINKSLSMIVEDINYFIHKVYNNTDRDYINNLNTFNKIRLLCDTGLYLKNESETVELIALRQTLPKNLNIERLSAITNEPTTKVFYDNIIKYYPEIKILNEEQNEETIYQLSDTISRDEAEYLSNLFKQLDYFSATTLAKQGLHSLGKFFSKTS